MATHYHETFLKMYEMGAEYEDPAADKVQHLFRRKSTQAEDMAGVDRFFLPGSLSSRTRNYKDWHKWDWKYQFTIRYHVPSENETEYQKILKEECADAFAYCWGEKVRGVPTVWEWMCIDLKELGNVFRSHREKGLEIPQNRLKTVGDVTFLICDIRKCPKKCLMGASIWIPGHETKGIPQP